MRETAMAYHRYRCGNCAQSVAHAWNEAHPDRPADVDAFSCCGGGRAPGGLCGALHAGCVLAGESAAESVKRAFAEKSGGFLTCREVRAARKLTCNECVGLAAELLEQNAEQGDGNEK